MKKKILTLILVFGLWTSFAFSNALEFLEAKALLDAQNGMSSKELSKKYSGIIDLIKDKDEYSFTFPFQIDKCRLSVDIDNFRFISKSKFIKIPITVGVQNEESFTIIFFTEKGTGKDIGTVFEYLFQRDVGENSYEEYLTDSIVFLGDDKNRNILSIPEECKFKKEILTKK